MQDIGGGNTRIVFEMVNWTPDSAVSLDLDLLTGLNQSSTTGTGITVVGAGFLGSNDWTVSSVPNSMSAAYSAGGGTPIPNIDLASPFANPFFPGLPDSGLNVLDGFELIVNGWGASERLSLNWTMGLTGPPDLLDRFDMGNWTMDRSSDPYMSTPGNLVLATTWEQPKPTPSNGFSPFDFANNPLDPAATDQNATTFGIPEPCSGLLLSLGLLLMGSRRRWC